MLEIVVVAMFVVTIGLALSVAAARFGRLYRLHRTIQIGLTICLAVTLVAFEADMRFVTDWRALAEESPWYERGRFNVVDAALAVHLCFAIPTPFVWATTLGLALRRFGRKRPSRPLFPRSPPVGLDLRDDDGPDDGDGVGVSLPGVRRDEGDVSLS
jgi:hypothetical protein